MTHKRFYSATASTRFSFHAFEALEASVKSIGMTRSEILRCALELWIAKGSFKSVSFKPEGTRLNLVKAHLLPQDAAILKAVAMEHGVTIGCVLERAFTDWFESRGGKLIHAISTTSKRKPRPTPKPVAEIVWDDEEDAAQILLTQLRHFQKTGNSLRVAHLRRKLEELGVAA